MSSVINWQFQLAEIEKLCSQRHYADVEIRCHQLLEKYSCELVDLIVQLRIRGYLFTSLEAQARYPEAQIQYSLHTLYWVMLKPSTPLRFRYP